MEQIGEIIIINFPIVIAEGKKRNLPPLGSIVKTDSNFLAIVVSHSVESKIPGRTPIAYWKTARELENEQPQTFELMRWLFQMVVFGTEENGNPEVSLPEKSVEIHSLVFPADIGIVKKLIDGKSFFNFVFNADENLFPQRNEIILRLLRDYFKTVPEEEKKKERVKVFSNLSKILRNDYPSLKKLMEGVKI